MAALQALASAFDTAKAEPPRKPVTRSPVVEVRKRRSLKEFEGRPAKSASSVTSSQRPAADVCSIQPRFMAPPLPASVVRQAVESANTRRNSLRLIAIHLKAGNHALIAAERSAWIAEASDALAAAGNDRDRAEKQVVVMVDVMLIDVAPRAAWSFS